MLRVYDLREGLPVFRCLSSPVRISILELLYETGRQSMTEIASALSLSNGALTPHIKVLSEAGFVTVTFETGKHGVLRMCSANEQRILIDPAQVSSDIHVYETEISVGQYIGYEAFPTCGLATPEHIVGKEDDPCYFASPQRAQAGILWFRQGYVEYLIPNFLQGDQQLIDLQISLELASEAPGSSEDWPSDIYFSLNGTALCHWTSPGDFGRVRGIYTPQWWPRHWNQHGLFKLLSVNQNGTFIDGNRISAITLADLHIHPGKQLKLRIAVPKDAQHVGGVTLYGRSFGNYDQDIRVRLHYRPAEEKQ